MRRSDTTVKLIYIGTILLFVLQTSAHAEEQRARGMLVASSKATLSSELAAKVIAVPKKVGESFKKGDPLIRLDCRLFKAQRDKVQSEVLVAQLKLENAQQLSKLNSIGTLDVAIAQAETEKIEAERIMAQLNVERCDIKAPFQGVVEQVDVHTHEIVQQQQALMKIVSLNSLEAEIIVSAHWMSWLEVGKAIVLHVEESQQQLEAVISHIGPSVDPTSQTIQIRAEIKKVPAKVLPGMSVVAIFN